MPCKFKKVCGLNGNSLIIDTNIVLYILDGNKELAELINNKEVYVSFVTELELLGFKDISKFEKKTIKSFLEYCTIININKSIKKHTLKVKQLKRMKLPDAIIYGTAKYLKIPLLTSDKGFKNIENFDFDLFEF